DFVDTWERPAYRSTRDCRSGSTSTKGNPSSPSRRDSAARTTRFFAGCAGCDAQGLQFDREGLSRDGAPRASIDWRPATAYAVGLMATDGNLSGRKGHLSLISKDADGIVGVFGAIHWRGPSDRPLWTLRYAKAESIRLLGWMYYSPDVPALARKRDRA